MGGVTVLSPSCRGDVLFVPLKAQTEDRRAVLADGGPSLECDVDRRPSGEAPHNGTSARCRTAISEECFFKMASMASRRCEGGSPVSSSSLSDSQ